jgi:hypothetical protein
MNILLFSMPDSFEHMPAIAIRMPNGALTSLAGNVDPHHQVAALDSCFASWSERLGDLETVVVRFGRVSDLVVVPRPPLGSVQGQRC